MLRLSVARYSGVQPPLLARFGSAPLLEQERGQLVVPVLRRHEQRAPAVAAHLVHVGAGVEENPHRLDVVRSHRIHKGRELSGRGLGRLVWLRWLQRERFVRLARFVRSARFGAASTARARPRAPPSALRSSAWPAARAAPWAATAFRGSPDFPSRAPRPGGAGFDRARRSAPRSTSSLTASGRARSAAHIRAVVPRRPSLAFTSAPASSSAFDRIRVAGAGREHEAGLAGRERLVRDRLPP